jgi:molybdopterin-binding protein
MLAADPPGRVSARNVLSARVERVELAGGDATVTLDAGERLVARLTAGAAQRLALHPGSQVHALIKAQTLRRIA